MRWTSSMSLIICWCLAWLIYSEGKISLCRQFLGNGCQAEPEIVVPFKHRNSNFFLFLFFFRSFIGIHGWFTLNVSLAACFCEFVCVPMSVMSVCIYLWNMIGSWFNLREKVLGECNQVDCVFVLLCVCLIQWRARVFTWRPRWTKLCVFVSSKLRLHSIKFDTSPNQLCKSHNNLALDLCCQRDNRDKLMYCLDDCKVELAEWLRWWTRKKLFQLTLNYHGINHMGRNDR